MPPNWESSSATFFNVSVFSRWCSFPLQKIVLHFSVPEPVPASRSAPCGSPGIVLILVNLPTKNSPPGRHGQEGCFQSIRFTIPAAWRSVRSHSGWFLFSPSSGFPVPHQSDFHQNNSADNLFLRVHSFLFT